MKYNTIYWRYTDTISQWYDWQERVVCSVLFPPEFIECDTITVTFYWKLSG